MKYLLTIIFSCGLFLLMASNGPDKPKLVNSEKALAYKMDCAQATAQTELNINNVRATLLVGGDFGWNGNEAGYVVPNVGPGEPEVSSIFAGAVWMGGLDPNGNLKLAAQQYGTSSGRSDYWPGPIDNIGLSQAETCVNWDRFFSISSSEIELHIAQYQQAQEENIDYDIDLLPKGIKEWPGLGNIFFFDQVGFELPTSLQGLAPFWDENGDGIYSPQFGDFPILETRGCVSPQYADEMKFWIFNDAGGVHTESGGDALQMEVQAMSFAFATADAINDMTFSRYKLINRAQESINDTYFGIWLDPDLGCSEDDYIGCDTIRDLMYVYNSDAVDGSSGDNCTGGVDTYADKIPYLGVDFYRGPRAPKVIGANGELVNPKIGQAADTIVELGMTSFIYFNRNSPTTQPNTTDPSTAQQYFHYLSGLWADGTPMTVGGNGIGGTITNKYAFHDEPRFEDGWSMCSANFSEEDRRTVQASGPFRLDPGQVNEVIIGIPWVPDVEYPCPDMSRLFNAADLAQSLFNSCFVNSLEGPDAPDLSLIPLDKKAIGILTNDPITSNNGNENYSEFDPLSPPNLTNDEGSYKFEGYLVYQLLDQDVRSDELNDTEKAKIVFQSDRQNGAEDIYNWIPVANPNAGPFDNPYIYTPELMVEGKNKGLNSSFEIEKDLFTNEPLINQKTYYYMTLAYGYNEYLPFDPFSLAGQVTPYIQSTRNIQVYSVTPQSEGNHDLTYDFGDGTSVTRLDGQGAGSNFLSISTEERERILAAQSPSGYQGTIVYEERSSPIRVKVVDPTNTVEGKYVLRFDQEESIESGDSGWELFDVESNESIARGSLKHQDERAFPDLGFSITVGQTPDSGDKIDERNGAIGQEISFSDPEKSWLSPVLNNANSPAELQFFDMNYLPTAGGELNSSLDPWQSYTNLGSGHFAPYTLMDWSNRANLFATPAWMSPQSTIVQNKNPLQDLNNVDVVFTNDKFMWSRCVVIETGNQYFEGEGFELDDDKRNFEVVSRPSVGIEDADGDGRPDPDGTGTGFAWFPGYAIDVETGIRLNIFFGENSAFGDNTVAPGLLESQNGSDMMFNPSGQAAIAPDPSVFVTPLHLTLGGMHYMYVTKQPYDECSFIYDKLTETLSFRRIDAVEQITWAGIGLRTPDVPLLSYAEGLIPTETVVKLRVDNPYRAELGINDNASYPSYEFGFSESFSTAVFNVDKKEEQLDQIEVFPNPVLYTAKLVLKEGKSLQGIHQIDIYNADGILQKSIEPSANTEYQLDVQDLHSGIYFFKTYTKEGKLHTGKFVKIRE